MSHASVDRVWQALLAVDQWLHDGFPELLESSEVVDPTEWHPIHEAARTLYAEQLALPPAIYQFGMAALKEGLEPTLNLFLDMMRAMLLARRLGDDEAADEWLEKVRAQLVVIRREYRARLLALKAEVDRHAATERGASEARQLVRLRRLLAERFSDSELRLLCFDLEVEYEDLPGEGKAAKAMELVALLKRRNRLADLIAVGKELRPDIEW